MRCSLAQLVDREGNDTEPFQELIARDI